MLSSQVIPQPRYQMEPPLCLGDLYSKTQQVTKTAKHLEPPQTQTLTLQRVPTLRGGGQGLRKREVSFWVSRAFTYLP